MKWFYVGNLVATLAVLAHFHGLSSAIFGLTAAMWASSATLRYCTEGSGR